MKRFKRFISKLTLCAMFVQIMSFGILGNAATTYASESEILDEPVVAKDIIYDIDDEPIETQVDDTTLTTTTFEYQKDKSIAWQWSYENLDAESFDGLDFELLRYEDIADISGELVEETILTKADFAINQWVSTDNMLEPGYYSIKWELNYTIDEIQDSAIGETERVELTEFIGIGLTPDFFAENVEIFAENPHAGGKIKLEVKDVADITEPLPGGLMAFGQYWVITEDTNNQVFVQGGDTKVTIRVWFTQADLDSAGITQDQMFSIYYYYVDKVDEVNNQWKTFEDITVEFDISQYYTDKDFIGYVQAVTTHFTDFVPVADIGLPTSQINTESQTFNTKSITLSYVADDQESGIDYVEFWYSYNNQPWQTDGVEYRDGIINFEAWANGLYMFYTKAVDKAGNYQEIEVENIKGYIVDVPTPSAPTNFKVVRTDGEVWLSWDGMGAWVDEYEIWLSNDANFSSYQIFRTNQTSYLIKGLLEGKRYFFKVKAVSLGGASEFSATSVIDVAGPSATPTAPVTVLEEILTTPEVQAQPAPVRDEEILEPPAMPEEEEEVVEEQEESDNARWIITIIILLLAAGAGVGGYYGYLWWQDRGTTPPPSSVKVTKKSTDLKSTKPKTATKRKSTRW